LGKFENREAFPLFHGSLEGLALVQSRGLPVRPISGKLLLVRLLRLCASQEQPQFDRFRQVVILVSTPEASTMDIASSVTGSDALAPNEENATTAATSNQRT